jgi:hypothetical protein
MPNPVAYNATTPPSGGFQRATITYGLSGSNYGANSPGGLTYYNSLPTSSAWVIISDSYTLGLSTQGNAKPVMWSTGSASTGSLIRLINGLPSMTSSFTDYYSAVNWLQSTNKYFLLNNGYENIVTDGLVLNLDAGWWNSYPTTGTTWTDLSGNNLNGTLTNGPTFNSANSGSIVFDGIDDYLTTTSFSLANTNNQISFDFWIKVTSPLGNVQTIFADGSQNNTIGYLFFYYNTNGSITYQFARTTTRSQVSTVIFSSEFINTWVNVVITTDYVSKEIKFYRNSTLLSTQTMVDAQFPSLNNVKFIGSYSARSNYGKGTLPSMRIYNRALSASEVLQNFNAQRSRFGL